MVKFFRSTVGLVATVLVLAQAPDALAQQVSGKAAPAGKGVVAGKVRKKSRKTAKKAVVTTTTTVPVAAASPATMTDAEREVMAAREQAYTDAKMAMADGSKVREVNGVMMPPNRTVFDNLRLSLDHTIFYQWIQRSNLAEKLTGQKITLLAPTNTAIKSDPGLMQVFSKAPSRDALMDFVVTDAPELLMQENDATIKTMGGAAYQIFRKDDVVMLRVGDGDPVNVNTADIKCSNGYLNLIDGTLSSKKAGTLRKQR